MTNVCVIDKTSCLVDSQESTLTPMMAQWTSCKEQVGDAILLFRLGDFYEAFGDDALIASQVLDLTLTKRQSTPMCGIPWHTSESYIDKLLVKGFSVAIAEQVSKDVSGKALMERRVVRVLTPATAMKGSLLCDSMHSLFISIAKYDDIFGIALVDVSTALFQVFEVTSKEELIAELLRLQPKEILCSTPFSAQETDLFTELQKSIFFKKSTAPSWTFDEKTSKTVLQNHFSVITLDGFGLSEKKAAISAAGALLSHLKDTLLAPVHHLKNLSCISNKKSLHLDRATLLNLEIFDSSSKSQGAISLFSLLNQTLTPMGARLLRSFLLNPLLSIPEIQERQALTQSFFQFIKDHPSFAEAAESSLASIKDIERIVLRLQTSGAGPRDVLFLATCIANIAPLKQALTALSHPEMTQKLKAIPDFSEILSLITNTLTDEPPLRISDGGAIKSGVHRELDELRALRDNSQSWLVDYQNRLREELSIKTLRVSYTRAFGFYIEVSRGQSDKVPPSFHRRQTLTNAERFISEELKVFEEKVLTAEKRTEVLETIVFDELKSQVIQYTDALLLAAKVIAECDVFFPFARLARSSNYVCPEMVEEPIFDVIEGRHPIAEKHALPFVANDIHLHAHGPSLLLITGPNMAGKSTFIRQTALLTIMAQIGSFIPAKKATIGIVDRVFSRIGASDDLFRGQSTFMVEMAETASILNQASPRSLILLDEIGRGTSTYDGISIAWAVVEHLLQNKKENPRTLFATHYFELTVLENEYPSLKNMTVAVSEEDSGVRFLYKVVPGTADKSYGIFVAKLAGLPHSVIKRAEVILSELEKKEDSHKKYSVPCFQPELFSLPKKVPEKTEETACYEFLRGLDLIKMTPLDCFAKLIRFKNSLK
jgi:DNA mismatch repair protein MutS